MYESTILHDPIHAYVTTHLARITRTPPDVVALHRAFEAADLALTAVERALEDGSPELADIGRHAYLVAIVLAKTIEALPFRDARVPRFQRTARNMLRVLERLATPADRALRVRVLGEDEAWPLPC